MTYLRQLLLAAFLALLSSTLSADVDKLTITGLREVFWIDVYEITLSTDKTVALERLTPWRDKRSGDTHDDPAFIAETTRLNWEITLDLKRNLTAEEVASAIRDALDTRLPETDKQKTLDAFVELFRGVNLESGDRLIFNANRDDLSVAITDKMKRRALRAETLGSAFVAIYLDNNAVIDDLTEKFIRLL